MEWHDKTCRRLDLADFGGGTSCLSCGSVRPTHPILPVIKQPSDIRILRVLPGSFDDDVECEIQTEDLSKDIDYEAISYTWADETGDASHCRTISVSGQPFKITRNCEMALKRVRRQYSTRNIWVDAICINQDDVSERGHQVGLMPRIYSGAKNVLMYIGEIPLCSPAVKIMDVQKLLDMNFPIPQSFWTEMLSSRYFTRLWVLQEVALARQAVLIFGGQSLSWSVVRNQAEQWNLKFTPSVFHFDHKAYSTPVQVINLLRLAKSCNASDPRDKIFALLGLLPSRRIGDIEADYSLTTEDLYTRVALHLASTAGWLSVLLNAGKDAQKDNGISSLPSWVPDWSARVRPDSTLAVSESSTIKEMKPLDCIHHESKKSLSLRLLYTPGLKPKWHRYEDYEALFRVRNLCFPLILSGDIQLTLEYWWSIFSTSILRRPIFELNIERHSQSPLAASEYISLRSLDLQMTEISTSQYSLISLGCQEYMSSKFLCLPTLVAVQMFTITSTEALHIIALQDWRFPDGTHWMRGVFNGIGVLLSRYDETGHFQAFPVGDAIQMLNVMEQWIQELEPVATELEELWMKKFLAGDLVNCRPEDFGKDETHEKELRISINDAFWRLVVRCFSSEEKTIEIV